MPGWWACPALCQRLFRCFIGAITLVQTKKGRNASADGFATKLTSATLVGQQFGVREKTVFLDAHERGSFVFSDPMWWWEVRLILSAWAAVPFGRSGRKPGPQPHRFRYEIEYSHAKILENIRRLAKFFA